MKFTKKQLSFGAFTGLILFGLIGVYFFYVGYDNWKEKRTYDRAIEAQRKVEEAYRNDTYGGKTPQETLDLFIEALRAGDVELASKYFALDDALDRSDWLDGLKKAKEENRLLEIISYLLKARPSENSDENFRKYYYGYHIKDENGDVISILTFVKNPVSDIWKIESL